MPNPLNLIGNSYGRLVAVSRLKNYKYKATYYFCICSCGGHNIISTSHLRSGATKSCGCLRDESTIRRNIENSTHKLSYSPIYRLWININSRCYNKKDNNYHNYGGRGISVCREWRDNRASFFKWAIENGYIEGLQIDRIKNNKGYYPKNCRFVTNKVNSRNKRTNKYLNYNGKEKCMTEWAEIYGINIGTFGSRIRSGWGVKETIETPVNHKIKIKD